MLSSKAQSDEQQSRNLMKLTTHGYWLVVALLFCPVSIADVVIVNARLVASPDSIAQPDTTIVVSNGKIKSIAQNVADRGILAGVEVIDAGGRFVTAGFWNSHVHFTDPRLATETQAMLDIMLLKYGFTSVLDTGSDLRNTLQIIAAIREGRLVGPDIFMANGSLVYKDGTPSYLPGVQLPEVVTPEQAAAIVNGVLDMGVAGIKIFSGSFISPTKTVLLPVVIIQAITRAAHKRGSFVIAHPTDRDGLVAAIDGGVDILAHTAPPAGVLEQKLLDRLVSNDISIVPTLKLWQWELNRHGVPEEDVSAYQSTGVQQLRDLHAAGVRVLFGTDVGYMQDFDTTDEFRLMAEASLTYRDILNSLTTAPAAQYGKVSGIVGVGEVGDLVILDADPLQDVTAFADVWKTIRGGEVVFSKD